MDPAVDTISMRFKELFGDRNEIAQSTKEFIVSMDALFRHRCQIYKESAQKTIDNLAVNLDFEWVDDAEWVAKEKVLQSRSVKRGERYIIQINWRFAASVHLLANRIFAQPGFEVSIFDKSPDQPDQILKDLHVDLPGKGLTMLESADPVRCLAAQQLALKALDLIFLHEASHIFCHHFEYMEQFKKIVEGPDLLERENAILSLQALEAEADRLALLHCLDETMNTAKIIQPLSSKLDEFYRINQLIYATKYNACQWLAFVFSILLKFPEVSWDEQKIKAATHPPNFVRQFLAINALASIANMEVEKSKRSAEDYKFCAHTLMITEAAICIMTGLPVGDLGRHGIPLDVLIERSALVSKRSKTLCDDISQRLGKGRDPEEVFAVSQPSTQKASGGKIDCT
jgi:hypothetical protein